MSLYLVMVLAGGLLMSAGVQPAGAETFSSDPLRAREFMVMGYQGIIGELSLVRGPYLGTLEDLLKVKPDEVAGFENRLREISKATPNIMDFADRVLALQSHGPRAPTPATSPASPSASAAAPPEGPSVYRGDRLEQALRHLARGMKVRVTLRSGETAEGSFADYDAGRLWLRAPGMKSFHHSEILAIESPDL